jgi:TatD DNase family protein
MELIDTHAHIYLPDFAEDRQQVIQSAKNEGIIKILMPAIDSSTHDDMQAVERQYDICISMVGLHPSSVKQDYEEELLLIENLLDRRKFAAIGEIGLDFYWDKTFINDQYACFHRQIQVAGKYNLPVVIHSRNAVDECIEVIQQYPGITGIFHCFSGTLHQANTIISTGFFLGIGGVVTFKNGGLDKILPEIPVEKMVLETDAPYLTPVPYRGKRNEISYIKYVAQKVAELKNISIEEVAEITTENAQSIFSI